MQNTRASTRIPVVFLLALLLGGAAHAQQVSELNIQTPSPGTFNSTNPFRTNSPILAIDFQHNGSTGNYFVTAEITPENQGNVGGATFLPQPTDTTGSVLAAFAGQGIKTINLILLQTRLNVVATTLTPLIVQFDNEPPNIQPSIQVTVGAGQGGVGGVQQTLTVPPFDPANPRARRLASPPINLSATELTATTSFRGTVTDNAAAANEIQMRVNTPLVGTAPQVTIANGVYTFDIQGVLATLPDGTYEVEILANDLVNDPATRADPANARGNESGPVIVQVIVDRRPPAVTSVEIIHFLGNSLVTEPAGAGVFVGSLVPNGRNEPPVQIRVTTSEPLVSAPRLFINQNVRAGTGNSVGPRLEAQLTTNPGPTPAAPLSVFTYNYALVAVEARNGPALLFVTGQEPTAANGNIGFGQDAAGNPIACNPAPDATAECADTLASFADQMNDFAFIVDTVAPDIRRENGAGAAIDRSGQANPPPNSVVSLRDFPRILTVQVQDYNTLNNNPADTAASFATDQASGVDFGRILPDPGQGGSPAPLSIQLTRRELDGSDTTINGTTIAQAPTTLAFALDPDFLRQLEASQRDPNHPVDGVYTVTLSLIDRVNNVTTRTYQFTVDTRPISESSLTVLIGAEGTASQVIRRTGNCLRWPGDPPAGPVNIAVSSTDRDFNTTATDIEVIGFFNGIDSQGYRAITTKTVDDSNPNARVINIEVTGIEKVPPPAADDFPVPQNPAAPSDQLDDGEFDPRAFLFDGPYTIRIIPEDNAGNRGVQTTSGNIEDSIDFDFNLDTKTPFTERTFPPDSSFINDPLRFVDATIVDPPAIRIPRGEVQGNHTSPLNVTAFRMVPGCGIDIAQSEMVWSLETPYTPNRVDRSLIVGDQQQGRLRGTLRFIHIPNDFDPAAPGFRPTDNRYKLLLELTDRNQNVRTLPTDGSMDGIYAIAVRPVDLAGNDFVERDAIQGANPPRRGEYFGLQRTNENSPIATDLVAFYFLYDTVAPRLTVDNFPENVLVPSFGFHRTPVTLANQGSVGEATNGGIVSSRHHQVLPAGPNFSVRNFEITGTVRDQSSRGLPGDAGSSFSGASGIDRVEYELKLVDENFVLVDPPGDPALDPATGRPGVLVRNPVIPLKRATLETFSPSIDPVPSTTDPLVGGMGNAPFTHDPFDTIVRPLHRYTIRDALPPAAEIIQPTPPQGPGDLEQFYVFVIRAYDRAGNFTETIRRVTLNPSQQLDAPQLLSPADETCVPRTAVELRWAPVTGITTYVLTISDPANTVTTREVEGTATIISLGREGRHVWNVASLDSLRQVGPASANRVFIIDRTPPRVTNIDITNPVQPLRRSGVLNLGQVQFTMTFSEPLDRSRPPGLTFRPPSVPPQIVTTDFFDGNVWRGTGIIPDNATPANWDGLTFVDVNSIFDACGNRLTRKPDTSFEIDTGPDFDVRFFFNPVDFREIILVIVATEELVLPPRVTELNGLVQLSNRTETVLGSNSTFFTSLKLNTFSQPSTVQLSISGEDLQGNNAKRRKSFTVTPINSSTRRVVASADGRLEMMIAEGSVSDARHMYIFPPQNRPESFEQARRAFRLPGADLGTASQDQAREVLDIETLHEVGPANLAFDRPVEVVVRGGDRPLPSGVESRQLGLYLNEGGSWRWVGAPHGDGTFRGAVQHAGALKIAADVRPPEVSLPITNGAEIEDLGEVVRGTVIDGGAGVAAGDVQVLVDDQAIPHQLDEVTGELSFELPPDLRTGRHRVEVAAKDRAGNISTSQHAQIVVGGGFGVVSVLPYPNPARISSTIRFQLTRPGQTARIETSIYDTTGKRVFRITEDGPFNTDHDQFWDLYTQRGQEVGNGVYFFKSTLHSTSGEKVKVDGKIAVSR